MDDFNEAVGIGLRLLHARDRFPEEIRSALAKKGIAEETIELAIKHLQRKGVLSESRAVEERLRIFSGKRAKGDAAVAADLGRLGASEEAVVEALEGQEDELSRARALIAVKYREKPDPGKAARFLNSRGFGEDTIRSILEDLGIDSIG